MKKILIKLLVFVFLNNTVAFAQEDLVLKEQLRGKNNYSDIMNVVEAYYKNPATVNRLGEKKLNRDLKHWRRWEWFMSSRLGPNGEFVNVNQKMIDAAGLQQNRKLLSSAGQKNAGNGSNTSQITAGDWALVGPTDHTPGIGRVDRLAFHPTDANTVYAGAASGGLWRTTNAGTSWTNLTPDIPCLGISGISINPNNPNIIYILTGDGDSDFSGGLVGGFGYMRLSIGVLKSTNGGANWTQSGVFPGADYSNLVGHRLTMHPSDPNILLASTSQGIFRTTDGGTTWNLANGSGRFFNAVFKPGSSTHCYAISRDGGVSKFFRSINGGLSFYQNENVDTMINAPTDRCEIAVAPSNSNVVYILAGGVYSDSGFYKGLYRSDDSGNDFVQKSNSPNILGGSNIGFDNNGQSSYDLSIAVSNTTSATVAVSAIRVWRSLDSGRTWVYRGGLHGDVHQLGYHPVGNKLWAATDGGVYSSPDNGATWTSHFVGMSISQVYRMAVNPDDYLHMLGGLQDNGAIQRDNGSSTFTQFNDSDGFTVGYDNVDSSVYYAIINRGVVRATNHGANTAGITPANTTRPMAPTLAIHPTSANSLYFAADGIWRSTNAINPNNWTFTANVQGGWALQTCPSNGNRVYVAGGTQYSSSTGILRRSDDAGVTWPAANILSNNDTFPAIFPKITYINVDPTNSTNVWVTFGGYTENVKVYYSTNAGNTWVNRSGTLPNLPVNCVVVDNDDNAYIGTDNGVYYWASGSNDWVPFYNNLPYVPVTDLVLSQANSKIRASTFGRGIWESSTYSVCPADLNISGTLEGHEFYEASNDIVSTGSLLSSAGTKVQMRGGNQVLLQAGFTASENTQFRAAIGPCGSGGVAGFRVPENDSVVKIPPRQYLPPVGGKKSMIHINSVTNNDIQFEITQKQNGVTDLLLTDEAGNIIRSKKFSASATGKWVNSISTAGLAKGMYYLQVLLDKRVEHMQEVEIR